MVFEPFEAVMRQAGATTVAIDTFRFHYMELLAGETGLVAEADIEPVETLPDARRLEPSEARALTALAHTVIIKLNGGLGTSMGLERAKSLLPVKNGQTFLDVIARQILSLRHQTGCAVPLLFMNSFSTDEDSRAALQTWPDLHVDGLPLTFVQNKIPKVLEDGYRLPDAVRYEAHAWCPPGHGDLYTALQGGGILDALIDGGFFHAFVSNVDNLGATLDLNILGYVVENGLPFVMEVADRTEADKKGGHLARRKRDGRLLLREVAQCPVSELPRFQDISRYLYFNTNSIWLDLRAVRRILDASAGIFRLPLIRNRKTLDPADPTSPTVLQLETAVGAAIELFDGSQAIRVPRARFAPVKLCSDLLALWSDAYFLSPDSHLLARAERPPVVILDPRYYKLLGDLQARFPFGPPSLCNCEQLTVEGDVTFGRDVTVQGRTHVRCRSENAAHVEDGSVLEGTIQLE